MQQQQQQQQPWLIQPRYRQAAASLSLPAAPGRAGAATWVAHLVPESWRSTGWVGSIRPWSRLPASFDRCEAQAEPVFVAARSPFLVVESTLVPLASVAGVSW